MYQVDAPNASAARRARFDSFTDAARCATAHARQHGEAKIRYRQTGALLADFVRRDDGKVSVVAVGEGKAMVEEWAR